MYIQAKRFWRYLTFYLPDNNLTAFILKKAFEVASRILFSSRPKSFLLSVTLLALIIRLGIIVFAAHPQQIIDDPHQTLLYEHGVIANNLYTGHGFAMHWPYDSFDSIRVAAMKQPPKWEGAFITPINPYLLYFSYLVCGETATALYAMMILYTLVTIFIPFVVFKMALLLGNERSARISAVLAALYVPGAYTIATFSGSALFQFLGLVVLYFAVRSVDQPSWKSFVWLGVSCGLLTGFRSEFFFLGPILIAVSLMLALRKHTIHPVLLQGLTSLALCFIIIAPWTIRNYEIYHKLVPVVSHPWREVWRGNNTVTEGTNWLANGKAIWENPSDFPMLIRRMDSIPYDKYFETKVDKVFESEVIEFIRTHPAQFLLLAGKKLFYFFTVDPNFRLSSSPIYWVPTIMISLLIIIGIVKLIRDRTKWNVGIPIFLFLGYYLFMTAMTLMQPRFQIYVFTSMLPVTGLTFFTPKRPNPSAVLTKL